jgi:hypothetical protein
MPPLTLSSCKNSLVEYHPEHALILWHFDPLLGNDREIRKNTTVTE